jgi:hypothetical protein
MDSAVRNYAAHLSGAYSWMLGRFVVPVGRIAEFEKAASPHFSDRTWKVNILGVPDAPLSGNGYTIDAMELKTENINAVLPGLINKYFEVNLEKAADIEAIAKAGARAKIRTGGLTADAVPSTVQVARFLSICHGANVAFKATAGLHHPVRGDHPFTMHGFLNVFLAAVLIGTGGGEQDAIRLLEEQSAAAISFDGESIFWQSYRFNQRQIAHARRTLAISFGSCSFDEPIHNLRALGWL